MEIIRDIAMTIAKELIELGASDQLPEIFKRAPVIYVAMGDSLSVGMWESDIADSWTTALSNELREQGLNFVMTKNLTSDWFTAGRIPKDRINRFKELEPTFATLLIGANDYRNKVEPEEFRKNFVRVMKKMIDALPSRDRLVVMKVIKTRFVHFIKKIKP